MQKEFKNKCLICSYGCDCYGYLCNGDPYNTPCGRTDELVFDNEPIKIISTEYDILTNEDFKKAVKRLDLSLFVTEYNSENQENEEVKVLSLGKMSYIKKYYICGNEDYTNVVCYMQSSNGISNPISYIISTKDIEKDSEIIIDLSTIEIDKSSVESSNSFS